MISRFSQKSQPDQYTINREIKKCFKSIIGSVQDYLDRLIATKNLFEETKTINARSLDEFKKSFEESYRSKLLEIATKRNDGARNKLKDLFIDRELSNIYDSLISLVELRNSIEHHKSLLINEKKIQYKRFSLRSQKTGQELCPGCDINAGDSIAATIVTEEIIFGSDEKINLESTPKSGKLIYLINNQIFNCVL